MLPENAHQLCSYRLGISLTKLWDMDNEIVSVFTSRRDLIDAVLCGCFIPLWSGSLTLPLFRRQKCIDGAYSNNKPKFNDQVPVRKLGELYRHIEICPFASETDVSPHGEFSLFKMRVFGTRYCFNWRNIKRTCHAMIPYTLRTYKRYLIGGYNDMKNFVLDSGLLMCSGCYLNLSQQVNANEHSFDPMPCLACLMVCEKVDSLKLPDRLIGIFER